MSNDFFKNEPEVKQEQQPETTKIKLGEKEYDQDELSQLVGLGESAREAEKKYNTKLDKVWPEYGRSQTKVKELEQQLQELETQKQQPQQQSDLNPAEIAQAKEAARKIGLVTDDQFGERLEKEFRKYYVQERAAEKLLEQCEKIEGEIDGKDGRPKFDKEDVLQHMAETGIRDPLRAYKDKYESDLDQWKEKKLNSMKKTGFITQEQSTGNKMPANTKIDDKNLREAIEESLYGGVRE